MSSAWNTYSRTTPSPPRCLPAPPESARSPNRVTRSGASMPIASTGSVNAVEPSVCRQSTPSLPSLAPVPAATSSLRMNGVPSARLPPNAIISDSPADAAGTRLGAASASALTIAPQMRLIVAVRRVDRGGRDGIDD